MRSSRNKAGKMITSRISYTAGGILRRISRRKRGPGTKGEQGVAVNRAF